MLSTCFLLKVLQVELVDFMRHAESEIASSSSSCCPSESFSVQRPECTCGKPWRVGRRRLGDCHRGVRNSRRKQGAGDSATSHRPRERAVRRVHMGTWRDSIHGRVGKRSVLPRRKRRPWERTLVHKGPLHLPGQRSELTLPRVTRGAARGKAPALGQLRRHGNHLKPEGSRGRRGARGSAKGDRSCGGQRRSIFVPSDQPSGGRSRRVRRNSSGPSPWGKRSDASKRSCNPMRCEPDSTWSLAERRSSNASHDKEVTPEPESKTIALPASRQREGQLSIGSTSCISGEGVSEHPRGTGRPAVSKAQDANDSCRKDHAASDAPGGSKGQARSKAHQGKNEEKEIDIIFSELDGECREFRSRVRRAGSRAMQRRNASVEAIQRRAPTVLSQDNRRPSGDDGGHPGSAGRSAAQTQFNWCPLFYLHALTKSPKYQTTYTE